MKNHLLVALALTFTLSEAAPADVHARSIWIEGSAPGFAVGHFDFDDESGVLTAWARYFLVTDPILSVQCVGPGGGFSFPLAFDDAPEGVAHGSAVLPASLHEAFFHGGFEVVFDMGATEIHGTLLAGRRFFRGVVLAPSQVVGNVTSPASGTVWVEHTVAGDLSITGNATALVGSVTSVELYRGAWYGEHGALALTFPNVATGPFNTQYSVNVVDPDPDVLRDLRDGLAYVLVRTDAFPGGEARAQIVGDSLGDRYCAGAPNSVAFIGAEILVHGSPRVADDDMSLFGDLLPPNRIVLPLVGTATGHTFGIFGADSAVCLTGAPIGRLSSLLGTSDSGGSFHAALDLSSLPAVGPVAAGGRLNFQLWFRDATDSGEPTTHFSNAISLHLR